jgi:alpha-beta hydrolase superfamily lysophospholipase
MGKAILMRDPGNEVRRLVKCLLYRKNTEEMEHKHAMIVDLVQVSTRDGVRLDGMYQPREPGTHTLALDACCMIHGTGGSFYSSTLFDALADRLPALGCGVLRVNTRGHDLMSTAVTTKGGRRLGAAYELVDDCRHDLSAWVDWLKEYAGPRVLLLGHSLGAVKALYALAHEPQLDVAAAIAISPPRLSYSWFCSNPQGPQFLETYALAEQHVAQGQPAALLEVKLPLPFVVTAAGYVEKYGPDERYNYLQFVGSVRCPVLVTLGGIEAEHNMAFRGVAEALADIGRRRPGLTVNVIPGADHFYSAARPDLLARIEAWLGVVFGPPMRS